MKPWCHTGVHITNTPIDHIHECRSDREELHQIMYQICVQVRDSPKWLRFHISQTCFVALFGVPVCCTSIVVCTCCGVSIFLQDCAGSVKSIQVFPSRAIQFEQIEFNANTIQCNSIASDVILWLSHAIQ